jgi:hypothetical protein
MILSNTIKKLKVWEWIFLGCIFIVLGCYAYSRLFCPSIESLYHKFGKPGIVDIKTHDFSNGDLIFLSGITGGEKSCRWLSGSPFSHVAIIFVEDRVPYVLECDIGSHHTDGIRILTLQKKLSRKEQHRIVGYRKLHYLFSKPEIEPSKFIDIYQKFHDMYKFDTNMTKWLSSSNKSKDGYHTIRKKMFCSEFVCFALEILGICTFDKMYYTYAPKDLVSSHKMNMSKGVIYSPLQLLDVRS